MTKQTKEEINGYCCLLASALAFSLMTVCVKHLSGRIPVAELVFTRALISLVITRLMIFNAKIDPWGKNKKLLLVRGILGTSALFCIFKALELLPLSAATIIQYTYPTFTAIAAAILIGEKLKRRIIVAVGLGWLGITLVVNQSSIETSVRELDFNAVWIGLAGAIFTALAYVSVRKLSSEEHPLVIVHYFPLISVPATLPFMAAKSVLPIGVEWIWLIGIGIFTQLGQLWITQGLSVIPAGKASSINYVQVLFATLWGIIIFSEQIDFWGCLGAICILGATLISLSSRRQFS